MVVPGGLEPPTLALSTRCSNQLSYGTVSTRLRDSNTGLTEPKNGGARRDRTDDLLNANQALFQLSYGPEYSVECESELLKEQRNLFSVTNCNQTPIARGLSTISV